MPDPAHSAPFGQLLRQHRVAAGFTQAALAERAGLSPRAIQHLEQGRGQPRGETLRLLAEALPLAPAQRDRFERAGQPAPRRRAPVDRARRIVGHDPENPSQAAGAAHGDLPGERKRVTVLVAEITGWTGSSQAFDPDLADRLLAGALPLLVDMVHRYAGTINRLDGGGLMALFGAPVAQEDDAVRACWAALGMHEVLARHAATVAGRAAVSMALHIGLDSGEVVLRTASNDLYPQYTALGPAVRGATRLQQLGRAGATWLTRETARLAEGYFVVRPAGVVPAAGSGQPLEVLELVGAEPAAARFQRVVRTRQLTRFVGREAELGSLGRTLERAAAGQGQVVALLGEPGVGKSRLVWELTQSQSTRGWLVLESGAVAAGRATAYQPVVDLLKAYCRIERRDDQRRSREKLTVKLLTLDRALTLSLPAFCSLLDLPAEDRRWQSLDPAQRRRETIDALKRLLLRESQAQPLLLIVEDLQWLDRETQTLLDALVESLPSSRLLLLVTYRPEYAHRWGNKPGYTQLRLDPLPMASAAALLGALLGEAPGLAPLKRQLIERTEGNPFFLEESVRTLVETGGLVGEPGGYRLARPLARLGVPATVQALLAARIDHLSPVDKRLLQVASVVGKDVPFPLLQAIADSSFDVSAPGSEQALPDEALRRGLDHLQTAELLYESGLFPDLAYTFKHALTHQVTYGGLLQEQRRELHARIVAAVETLHRERLDEQAELLAYHALRGELWEQAVAYLHQAGLRAMARAANREATAHLEGALEALRRLPETRETTALAIDLRLDLRNALQPLAERTRMGEHLQEAERLARRLGDQQRIARILTFLINQRAAGGAYDDAVRYGQEALRIGRNLGDRSIEVVATTLLGRVRVARGECGEAATLFARNVALEGDLRNQRFGAPAIQAVHSAGHMADVLSQLGRFDEAIAHGERAVQAAKAAEHAFTLCWGLFGLGRAYLRRGDLACATGILEENLDLCQTWQIQLGTPFVAATLGVAFALAGRIDAALKLAAEQVEEFHRRQIHTWPGLLLLCAGRSYLAAGRLDEAARQIHEALALTGRLGARASLAEAHWLAAELASADVARQAEGHYRQALALADELGLRPLVAHCHLGLGRLCRRSGRANEARSELTNAVEMLRAMEMTLWLSGAEAELKAL